MPEYVIYWPIMNLRRTTSGTLRLNSFFNTCVKKVGNATEKIYIGHQRPIVIYILYTKEQMMTTITKNMYSNACCVSSTLKNTPPNLN